MCEQSRNHPGAGKFFSLVQNFVWNNVDCNFTFRFSAAGSQFFLSQNQRLATFLAELQSSIKIGFRKFFRRAFEHHDVVRIAHIDQIKVALRHLGVRRIHHELPLNTPNPHCAQRTFPRDITDHQGGRSADDAEHIRVVFAISAQHDRLDLDFVVPALGEQRSNGSVSQSAGENLLFGWPSFPFEVTARELAGGRCFLAVIDRQREKILARFGLGCSHCGDDHNRLAELDGHCAVSLFCIFACFYNDLFIGHLGHDSFCHIVDCRRAQRNFSKSRFRIGAE